MASVPMNTTNATATTPVNGTTTSTAIHSLSPESQGDIFFFTMMSDDVIPSSCGMVRMAGSKTGKGFASYLIYIILKFQSSSLPTLYRHSPTFYRHAWTLIDSSGNISHRSISRRDSVVGLELLDFWYSHLHIL